MATKEGKKRGKEEKKSAKKVEEPPPVVEEKKDENSHEEHKISFENQNETECQLVQDLPPPKSPEPIYDEPLSKLIIER